jgi:hypothetical protein
MPGSWKKILVEGDIAATLSDADPESVDGTAADPGESLDASRADHGHPLGPLVAALDFDQNSPTSLVLESVSTPPDTGTEVGGEVYFDTDDKHPYVWVP